MKFLSKVIEFWLAWILPRPLLVLGAVLLSAVGCMYYASQHLEIETDQLELIAPNHPLVALSDKLEPYNLDGKTTFTLVVEASRPERAISFMNALGPRIREDREHFKRISYRIDPNDFKEWALLYLSESEIQELGKDLDKYADLIRGLAGRPDVGELLTVVNRQISREMVGELFTGFLDEGAGAEGSDNTPETMDLEFLIRTLEGLNSFLEGESRYSSPWGALFKGAAGELDEEEGYFWQADRRFLIATVVPEKIRDGGVSYYEDSLERLRQLIREAQRAFPDVSAGVTGQEALNIDEMTTVMGDMDKATWISLGGVLLLMMLMLRSIRRPVIEMVSLCVGLAWTFGWTTFFIGHLNILSVVFAPLLVGLGDDYGIHWFSRFNEEEVKGDPQVRPVIERVMRLSGPGIVLAGLSTAFSFLPFVLTGFRGLMELGLITGVGTVLLMISDLTILSILSLYFSGYRGARRSHDPRREEGDLVRLTPLAARVLVMVVAVTCVFSGLMASRVEFDLNPLRLQARSAEAVVWEKKLVESSERSLLAASAFASSSGELMEKAKKLEALPVVAEVETLYSFLPEGQEEKIPLLRALTPKVPPLSPQPPAMKLTDREALRTTLERIRFKMNEEQAAQWDAPPSTLEQMADVRDMAGKAIELLQWGGNEQVQEGLERYRERFYEDLSTTWQHLRDGAAVPLMRAEDLPQSLKERYSHEGEYLLKIYPRESVWEQGALSRFVQGIKGVDPQVTGDTVSLHVFSEAFKSACIQASGYALLFVSVLLLSTFRSLKLTLFALAPLVVGSLWTVGIMGWIGMDFNLANSIFMPPVVGAGVEYGVVILHRWRGGGVKPGHLPMGTGRGVILAALTTSVAFGTLMISQHQGIFSLGFVAGTGSLCVLFTALLIIPALLALTEKEPQPEMPSNPHDPAERSKE